MESALFSNSGSGDSALKDLSAAAKAAYDAFKAADSAFFPLDAQSPVIRRFIFLFDKAIMETQAETEALYAQPQYAKFTIDFFKNVDSIKNKLHQIAEIVMPLSRLWRDECQRPHICYCNSSDNATMNDISRRLQPMWHSTLKMALALHRETMRISEDFSLLLHEWECIISKVKEHITSVKMGARRAPLKPPIEDTEIFLVCKRSNFQLAIFLPAAYAHYSFWDCFSLALWLELDKTDMTPLEREVFDDDVTMRDFFNEALALLPEMAGMKKIRGNELLAFAMIICKAKEATQRKVDLAKVEAMLLEKMSKMEHSPAFPKMKSLREFFTNPKHSQPDTKVDKTLTKILHSDTWKQLLASKAGDMQALLISID